MAFGAHPGADFRLKNYSETGSSQKWSCGVLQTQHSHSGPGNTVEHMQRDAQAKLRSAAVAKRVKNCDLSQMCMLPSDTLGSRHCLARSSAVVDVGYVQGLGRSCSSSGLPALWTERWEAVRAASIRSASSYSVQDVTAAQVPDMHSAQLLRSAELGCQSR